MTTGIKYKPKYAMVGEGGELYIKVNFPNCAEAERNGNGEGMWVEVDEATSRKLDEDYSGGEFHGVLSNDSVYYPGLEAGTEVPFSMRGKNRPVAPLAWLEENYGKSTW